MTLAYSAGYLRFSGARREAYNSLQRGDCGIAELLSSASAKGLKNMPWMKVSIDESDVADISARALMEQFSKQYRAAGAPSDAEVYHRKIPAVGHAFYFSPRASAVAEDVLAKFKAVALSGQPNLEGVKPIAL